MTANQISYWTLQENKRHNSETEKQADRVNTAQISKWRTEQGTSIANSVTGGIKNISQAIFGSGGVVGAVSGGKQALTGLIGFGG